MKKILTILIAAAVMIIAPAAQAQKTYTMFHSGDTVSTVTTKALTLIVGSPGGMTVQFDYTSIGATIAGRAQLEYSIDGVKYYPYNTDTCFISSATTGKIWKVEPEYKEYQYPPYWEVLVTVATASGGGSGIVKGKVYK